MSADEGGAPATSPDGKVTVSLDLRHYERGESLFIANDTLVFPLAPSPSQRVLSESAPGDLVIAYTRVGCNVDPERWIGSMGVVPVTVVPTAPSTLMTVTIVFDPTTQALSTGEWMQTTCLSFRHEGTWQPFTRPNQVDATATATTVKFAPAGAVSDAAAIFLPSYANVSGISYELGPL
jgi:hypothetical protein